MAAPDPTAARFPEVPRKAGHYESFYIKACHPDGGLGVWIRYTVHKRPDSPPRGSLWFTLFDRSAEGPRASKVTLPGPEAGGDWIRIGSARLAAGKAVGAAPSDERDAAWDLNFSAPEPPLFHLPRGWMYTAPLPRTKLLSPAPAARFDGKLTLDGQEIAVEGWRGMIGHNWGAEHAERWIWMHALALDNSGKPVWLDAALGKIKLGPLTTPWVGNGAISLDGARHAVGGPGRRVEVRESPTGCEFTIPGKGVKVQGRVGADKKDFVGWVYADPDGPEHNTVNCSVADMTLTIEAGGGSEQVEISGGAAYELGMRERDHGMEIQPFPDG
jgi:hypothetical protein